jgi:hypothetical protein
MDIYCFLRHGQTKFINKCRQPFFLQNYCYLKLPSAKSLQRLVKKKRAKSIVTKALFVKTLACFAFEIDEREKDFFYNS